MCNYVLDIGSGMKPQKEANLFLEKYLDKNKHTDFNGKAKIIDNLIIGDGCFLPFKTNSINKVLSRHVIEHVDNPILFLEECKRVSDGNIMVSFPSLINEIHRILLFDDDAVKRGHKWVYDINNASWIDFKEIYRRKPSYTFWQRMYLEAIKLLPRSIKHVLISNYVYILNEWCGNFGLWIEDNKITK